MTREEVADVLRSAFENGARSEVVHVLAHLSETRFHRLQDLWADLADLPIDLGSEASR